VNGEPIFYCYIAAQSAPHQNCSISFSPAAHLALFVGYCLAFLAVIYLYVYAFLTHATYQVNTTHDDIALLTYLKDKSI
jgi:hypothetical protein